MKWPLVGKKPNANSEYNEQRERTALRLLRRVLRDDASVQQKWDKRKQLRLKNMLSHLGRENTIKKI